MKFTEDFKARCKKVYPDWERLHEKLEEGSDLVGRYLNDSRESGIDYEEILSATSLDELKAAALLIKEQNDLYQDFANGSCWETAKTKQPTPELDFFIFMRNAFNRMPATVDKQNISATEFYQYVCENDGFDALREFLSTHELTGDDNEFLECFYHVQKDWQRQRESEKTSPTKNLASLIAAAQSISDQSAQLTSDLQKHKNSLERE